eukprot:560608-Rhodomonas_salina.3
MAFRQGQRLHTANVLVVWQHDPISQYRMWRVLQHWRLCSTHTGCNIANHSFEGRLVPARSWSTDIRTSIHVHVMY